MADVWILQDSGKQVVGVYGTRAVANSHTVDENSRALPFDVVDQQPGGRVWIAQAPDLNVLGVFGSHDLAVRSSSSDVSILEMTVVQPRPGSTLSQPAQAESVLPPQQPVVVTSPVAAPPVVEQPVQEPVYQEAIPEEVREEPTPVAVEVPADAVVNSHSDLVWEEPASEQVSNVTDYEPVATALHESIVSVIAVLKNAKAPSKIVEAVEEITYAATSLYNETKNASPPRSDVIDDNEALNFMFGGEHSTDSETAQTSQGIEDAPEFAPYTGEPSNIDDEGIDDFVSDVPPPVSGFGTFLHDEGTGLGGSVVGNPNATEQVVGLSSWVVPNGSPSTIITEDEGNGVII